MSLQIIIKMLLGPPSKQIDQDMLKNTYTCIEAILPLFNESSATPEMVRHDMTLIKQLAPDENFSQILVMAVDQPLYDLAKKIQ